MTGRKSLYLHLAAVVVAAAATAVVFGLPERKGKRRVVIIDQELAALTGLTLSGPDKTLRVTPRPGGGFTIEVQMPEKKASGATGPDSQKQKQAAKPRNVQRYRASREFVKELERLLPLRAERELGHLPADKLKEYGFDGEPRRLELQFGQQRGVFELGGQTYGGATLYLRRQEDGMVYLVSTSLQRTLDFRPPRYLERRLVEPGRNDVDELQLSDATRQKQRTLVKTGKPGKERWRPADDPESSNNLYGTWVGQLFLLGAEAYLEKPPQPEPRQLARISFRKRGETIDELLLAESEQPASGGQQQSPKLKKLYFARSKFTGQWVRLRSTGLGTFFKDLPNILGQ